MCPIVAFLFLLLSYVAAVQELASLSEQDEESPAADLELELPEEEQEQDCDLVNLCWLCDGCSNPASGRRGLVLKKN
jgi:hypothetical protein